MERSKEYPYGTSGKLGICRSVLKRIEYFRSKPDAFKIICKKAEVKTEEIKPEEAVWVKGVLEYKILYLTDEKTTM